MKSHRPSFRLLRWDKWLVVEFPNPCAVVSWAIVGGGLRIAPAVAWREVGSRDLAPPVRPAEFLAAQLEAEGLRDAVGLLTSRSLDSYVDVEKRYDGMTARSISTVGMSNAVRAGDPPGPAAKDCTINLLCHLSRPLSVEAFVESLQIAVEARTAAVLEACIGSTRSGSPATGTGTDCVVIAAPEGEPAVRHAGKHTALGHLIGSVVYEATRQGLKRWKKEVGHDDGSNKDEEKIETVSARAGAVL